jgi:hypothetical protein
MFRHFRSDFRVLASCAALGLVFAPKADARPQPRPAPITLTGSCKISRTEVITTDEPAVVSATDWQPVPNGLVDFVSRKPGCVIVTLSAVVDSEVDYLAVQMVLDGTKVCGPAYGFQEASIIEAPDVAYKALSMTYFCKDVSTGQHSLQAQYATMNGNMAALISHTLTVAHN